MQARFDEWIADVKGSCLRAVNLISVKVAACWATRVARPLYCLFCFLMNTELLWYWGAFLDCSVAILSVEAVVFPEPQASITNSLVAA